MTFWQLFVADLKSLVRNRMALFWFLVFPVIFILIFGAVFSGSQQASFEIGLVSPAGDPVAAAIQKGFAEVKAFHVHDGARESELSAMKAGHRALVVEIPEGAAARGAAGGQGEVSVYYEKGREQTGMMLFSIVSQMLNEVERTLAGRPRLLEAKLAAYQTTPLKYIDFLLPGILAMALMQLGFFGSFQMVSLREQKVLKALGATPLPRLYVLGTAVLVRLLLSLVQLAVSVSIGVLVFGVHITGNWLAILGVVILGGLTFISLGYMLTARARTVDSGQGLVQIVQFPMMFLSGVFFPLNVIPGFLKPVVTILPLTYLGDALRQVMVGMSPTYSLSVCLVVLAGWLVGSLAIAVWLWRWE
jgi:ABC-2 type transport system permease protein